MQPIRLEQVRTNNLAGFDLQLNPREIVLICGVSGSGKSSLAFDTIFAAGQQRFLETLSTAARETLSRVPPPDAARIENVPPTIALRQDDSTVDSRLTVGAATDLAVLLAEVFANAGQWHCPACDGRLSSWDAAAIGNEIGELPSQTSVMIGFPLDGLGATLADQLSLLEHAGFRRVFVNGSVNRIGDVDVGPTSADEPAVALVDRVTVGKTSPERIVESVATALRAGAGRCVIAESPRHDRPDEGQSKPREATQWRRFSEHWACQCGYELGNVPGVEDLLATSPRGVCHECNGSGSRSGNEACQACDESRLGPSSLLCEYGGTRFRSAMLRPVSELQSELEADLVQFANPHLVEAIRARFAVMRQLGLGHLSLGRGLSTLSSGERLRVRLAGIAAADAVETLFVLDEPTAGLAPTEIPPVMEVVRELHHRENGVVVVDHAPTFLGVCDRVIELGPRAGAGGGEIVFDGTAEEFQHADTLTACAFRAQITTTINVSVSDQSSPRFARVAGLDTRVASGLEVDFPLAAVTAVTGPSGAGKSSLLTAMRDRFESTLGDGPFSQIVAMGGPAIAPAQRSCLATQVRVFDAIRKLFESLPESQARGLTAKHFSFNVAGSGRCGYCQGRGELEIDMGHLQRLGVRCPRCNGTRYEADVREIKYRRRSIADVLAMSVDEAVQDFRTELAICRKLQPVRDVGLGYVTLGQPLATLSGGERQRLQLAGHLGATSRGHTLFLFDEPVRGLHPADVDVLLGVFARLVDVGHTLVIADHNPRLHQMARHQIELGFDHRLVQKTSAGPREVAANL